MRANPAARRLEIVDAAARVFAAKGVSRATVSDVVRAAGVAQGTFYLYFESKDEVVLAVVDQLADRVFTTIQAAVQPIDGPAAEALLALAGALAAAASDESLAEVADFIHRPENRAIHDRLEDHLLPRLVPLVRSIVARGIANGSFDPPDAEVATWFVLGGLRGVERAGTRLEQMPVAIDEACLLALRALGWREPDE